MVGIFSLIQSLAGERVRLSISRESRERSVAFSGRKFVEEKAIYFHGYIVFPKPVPEANE